MKKKKNRFFVQKYTKFTEEEKLELFQDYQEERFNELDYEGPKINYKEFIDTLTDEELVRYMQPIIFNGVVFNANRIEEFKLELRRRKLKKLNGEQ